MREIHRMLHTEEKAMVRFCRNRWETNQQEVARKMKGPAFTLALCLFVLLAACSSPRTRRRRNSVLTANSRCISCCRATSPARETRCLSTTVSTVPQSSEMLLGEDPGSGDQIQVVSVSSVLPLFPSSYIAKNNVL